MTIKFKAYAAASSTGSNFLTINKPSGTVEGDIMVVTLASDTSGGNWGQLAGWTQLHDETVGATMRTALMYKEALAGEPASYTFENTSGADHVGQIQIAHHDRGVWNNPSLQSAITHADPDTTLATGSLTATPGDLMIAAWSSDSGLAVTGPPAGMLLTENTTINTMGIVGYHYHVDNVVAGAITKSLTFSASDQISAVAIILSENFQAESVTTAPTIKRIWTRQPPIGIKIDWSNPLTSGLVFAGPDTHGMDISGRARNLSGPGVWESTVERPFSTVHGVGFNNPDNDNGGLQWLDEQLIDDDSPVTVMVLANPLNEAFAQTLVAVGDSVGRFGAGLLVNTDSTPAVSSGTLSCGFRLDASNIMMRQSTSATIVDGEFHIFSFSGTPGTSSDLALYLNGVALAGSNNVAGDTTGWSTGTLSTAVGKSAEGAANNNPIGAHIITMVWRRIFSPSEHKALADNPWQIFKPRTIYPIEAPDRNLVVF